MTGRLFDLECFFARVMGAEKDGYENNEGAHLHEDFAAVEPVDGGALEVRVGEKRVPEERNGAEVDGEVEGFPGTAAELNPEIRGDDHNGDDVKSDRTDTVFERLLRRVNGTNKIDDAKMRRLVEEKNNRVNDGEKKRDIAGPIVEAEIVEAAMRPGADRAVTKGHHHAEKHIDGESANGDEAEIG